MCCLLLLSGGMQSVPLDRVSGFTSGLSHQRLKQLCLGALLFNSVWSVDKSYQLVIELSGKSIYNYKSYDLIK